MRWILLACSAALAFAEGTEPKKKATEYDVSAKADEVEIGAEFMVHSFSGEGQMFISENHLIVEVAFYPPKDGTVNVKTSDFTLRVNGKKPALSPLSPESFAAELKRSNSPFSMGGGGGPDVMNRGPFPSPGSGGPFPRRTPSPPRAPSAGPPGGIDRREPVEASDAAVASALPQGETKHPVAGFLYFPYRGKISGIKSLELVYDRTVLKLR